MKKNYPNPYYIIAPPYVRTSAGIRVLYKLADMINKAGGSAFIYLRPRSYHDFAASPMDVAPFLTQKTIDYHFNNKLTPIVIYPETIKVNRFNPPIRIRYLLNYDNLLFKNDPLSDDDFIISYSKNISDNIKINIPHSTLFIPVSDHLFFSPPPDGTIRSGACYYAGKFKYKFKGKTFPITDGLVEITRDKLFSQTPYEIRKLFRSCELFYCYEDSALALEAKLCGCPTVWLPNKFFHSSLGSHEVSGLGSAWGYSADQILYAKKTVSLFRDRYLELLLNSNDRVIELINTTQQISKSIIYSEKFLSKLPIRVNLISTLVGFMLFIKDSIEDRGLLELTKIIYKRVLSGRINFTKSYF